MATFVLLHGAYHAGWHFHLLGRELESQGHRTFAPDLPCDDPTADAEQYADLIEKLLRSVDDEIVIVGHSLTGLCIPLLPARNVRISRLVYLGALLPEPGLSLDDQVKRDPTIFADYKPAVDAIANRDGSATCPEGRAIAVFFHDCPLDLAREAAAHLRPQHWRHSQEITPLTAWPDIPSTYVVCTDDRAVNPAWSRTAARERLGVDAIEIEGSHSPFLSRPAELANLLIAAM